MAVSARFSASEVSKILTAYLLEEKPPIGSSPNPLNWSKYDDRVWTVAGAAPVTFQVTATKKPKSKA